MCFFIYIYVRHRLSRIEGMSGRTGCGKRRLNVQMPLCCKRRSHHWRIPRVRLTVSEVIRFDLGELNAQDHVNPILRRAWEMEQRRT